LRILHLSDHGIPDWRIEKTAISESKLGHEVMFAGPNDGEISYNTKTFSKVYEINWTIAARFGLPLYWNSIKKQTANVINEAKPDIVHAHYIFSAKMISEFGLPFVYNDPECEPIYVRAHIAEATASYRNSSRVREGTLSTMRRIAKAAAWDLIMKHRAITLRTDWQNELISSAPIIVPSNRAAEEIRKTNDTAKLFVIPNFPSMSEVKDFERPRFNTKLSSVFAGYDGSKEILATWYTRRLDGVHELFEDNDIGALAMIGVKGESSAKIKYMGFLPRQSMYEEMFKHSVGLYPTNKHWSHRICSPNKIYEYAHAGLFVLCASSFETVIEDLKGNCAVFEDHDDMVSQLKYYKENLDELYNKRVKTFNIARDNLIWENYEKNIARAYQAA
jgi:glycosyltransferase involved in cell wall biosynthesis